MKNNFYQSANIESDFNNVDILKQIIITKQIKSVINNVQKVIDGNSNNSSISIVGPYGSGKTTTSLVLYHYLRNTLTRGFKTKLKKEIPTLKNGDFKDSECKLITGIKSSIEKDLKKRFNIRKNIVSHIENNILNKNKKLLLIVDEFGKYLEYGSENPKEGDVYILQQLAELSSRSNGNFIFITIRHQAISAYFEGLTNSQLSEWKKIQGRFHDIVHTNTFSESLRLFAQAFEQKFKVKNAKVPGVLIKSIRKNSNIDSETINILEKLYPLHPYTVLIMISAYKTFAQNERSIFSFIYSDGKYSLNEFINQKQNKLYEVSEFYEYIRTHLEHYIADSNIYSDYLMINNGLEQLNANSNDLDMKTFNSLSSIIKCTGMLNIFGKEVGLNSTIKTIVNANFGNSSTKTSDTKKADITTIYDKGIFTYRKLFETYHLWEGTDLDLNKLIENEVSLIEKNIDIAYALNEDYSINPVVARKHYIETGTLRYAKWEFVSSGDLVNVDLEDGNAAVCCFICTSDLDRKKVVKEIGRLKIDNERKFLAVLQLTKSSLNIIYFYKAVSNLLLNSDLLSKDRIARKEIKLLQSRYRHRLDDIISSHQSHGNKFYFVENKKLVKTPLKQFGKKISDRFDMIYDFTPIIKNELINRYKPSASANYGVKLLFQNLLENSHKYKYGIEKSGPESSIYLSVIQQTQMHQDDGMGNYKNQYPSEKGLSALWKKWDNNLKSTKGGDERLNLLELEKIAYEPPYGLTPGLARFLAVYKILTSLDRISIYQKKWEINDFTYIAKIFTDNLELMYRRPELFEIRYVETKGIHQSLFHRLNSLLSDKSPDIISLLDVAKSLIEFVNRLSNHTKKTKDRISVQSKNVINAVLSAKSPEKLIYKDLPKAVGFNKSIENNLTDKTIHDFVKKVEEVMNNLEQCDDTLHDLILDKIIHFWGLKIGKIESVKRQLIKHFPDSITGLITDSKMRVFAQRIHDSKRKGKDWLESISGHIVGKLPMNWTDDDIIHFQDNLRLMRLQLSQLQKLADISIDSIDLNNENIVKIENQLSKYIDSLKLNDAETYMALGNLQKQIENKLKAKSNG